MRTILHLGLGRFHRGHQAVYYQKAGGWRVISSTMRSPDERDKLRAVNLRYPVLELSHDSENLIWIDCIGEALSLHHDLPRLLEVIKDSTTEIVTLTVTEKGYCLNSQGELDFQHKGIVQDLSNPEAPSTAIGFLALGLMKRKSPLTVISCDNVSENGKKLSAAVLSYMKKLGWDAEGSFSRTSFPCTMVDRIVPALLPEKIAELEQQHGLKNSELIATESFSQWVIEDDFKTPRPDWDKVGVEFVKDVRPFEEIKLRVLNASHSYLAYGGLNRGYRFVHETMGDETLRKNVIGMVRDEIDPSLPVPDGHNPETYLNLMIGRFMNFKLPHQLRQIAMDGSLKIPLRILPSIREARQHQLPCPLLLRAVDEWLEFLWNNKDSKIDDPKAQELLSGSEEGKSAWKQRVWESFLRG